MASGLPVHRLLMLATLLMSLLFCAPASAQKGPDKETAAKVLRLVKDANDEFDRGEFADALSLYEEAYDLYPDAVLLYRIGLSADKAQKPRRAVEAYQAFVDAAKSDDATAKKVTERIAKLEATMPPRVTITTLPAGADVFVGDVDGPALGQTPGDFDIDTGEVVLAIRLKGYKVEKRTLTLEYGEAETIDVELEALEGLAKTTPTDERPSDGGGSLGTIGWITTGVGVALLGTGGVFAALAVGATNDVNDYDKRAPDASRVELDDLKDKANGLHSTSVITFVAGGVVTAVGVSLIIVDALTKNDESSARVAPTMGIGQHGAWVGVGGRF